MERPPIFDRTSSPKAFVEHHPRPPAHLALTPVFAGASPDADADPSRPPSHSGSVRQSFASCRPAPRSNREYLFPYQPAVPPVVKPRLELRASVRERLWFE